MNGYKVYIEDELIDLDPRSVIGLTLQASAIGSGDLVNRRASYTNQIKVPRTTTNVGVLGHSHILASVTTVPFVKKSCRITSNGFEILNGVAIVKSFERDFALQIFALPKDIAIELGGKMLDELDFGDSPVTWNEAYMDSRRNATTGFCAPVIDYGQIDPAATNSSVTPYNLPSVALKDIVTAILDNAGYTVSGDFYDNDAFFNNMAFTYGRRSWPGTSFKLNEVLPDDVTQKDFLSDIFIKFCLQTRITADLDVELLPMETILNDRAGAANWTKKRANKRERIEFAWDSWAQVNNFKYPDRDVALDFNNYYTNNGALTVANVNIKADRTVYTSITAQDDSVRTYPPGFIAYRRASVFPQIIMGAGQAIYTSVPSDYVFNNTPRGMLVLLRDPTTFTDPFAGTVVEGAIYYDGNSRTDYKVASFAISPYNGNLLVYTPELNNMRWANSFGTAKGFLELYYATLQGILTAGAKKVTRQYLLTDIDIYALDLLQLVYDKDEFFLISKVGPYVSGRITTVELLKL
jgi:hypothetical protein